MNRSAMSVVIALVLAVSVCSVRTGRANEESAEERVRRPFIYVKVPVSSHNDVIFHIFPARYRIIVQDESGDGRADHWVLRVADKLKFERWSTTGHGTPDEVRVHDDTGYLDESSPLKFTVTLDTSSGFEAQVIEIHDGAKYQVEIRDESGDGEADSWVLLVDGVLRAETWATSGQEMPNMVAQYDETGRFISSASIVYKW